MALTRADCTDDLPSFSVETKSRDPRYAWFKRNYGDRCWELDAMNPNDLRRRLRNEIIRRIDMDAWAHCQTTEAAERESLNAYIRAWPKSIFEPDRKCHGAIEEGALNALFPPRPHLRLVHSAPRPRRIDVRITAADGRFPIGRTRLLRLTERDFARLLETAERLEARP